MSDPISDSLKPRPDQGPSDERFPTPWSMSGSAVPKILDAEGDKVASAQRYYPYIKESAMPFIVHRVNSFDSLLEACRATLRRGCGCCSPKDETWHAPSCPIAIVRAAIESAGM